MAPLPGLISAQDIARAIGRPEPTPEQVAVIEAPLGPVLVVAGAGSGKTETMAARVVWLVANQFTTPDRVLGLTFTRKAAGELAERVRRRLRRLATQGLVPDLEDSDADAAISTYHAYAGRLVREYALRLGVEPESRLLTEAAAWQYAHEVVESWDGDMSEVDKSPSTIVDALLRLSAECSEHLVTPERLLDYLDELQARVQAVPIASSARSSAPPAKVRELLEAITIRRRLVPMLREYTARKQAREALDFGDQLALAARLAVGFPDIGAGERVRSGVVLLDEFQDTSHAQMVMLHALFGDGHPVTAVGDPHQSIYGWRGASADTLSEFLERFALGDARPQLLTLSTSWRNDRAILDAANVVADPLRALARGRGSIEVPPLLERPDAGPGSVEIGRQLTREDEAQAIASWIVRRGAPYSATAAVLCRTRSQFIAIEEALRAAGLPVEVVGLGGLLSTPEIVDVVSTLQVVSDPERGDAVMRLLTGPLCRLGARDLRALGRWAQVQRGQTAHPEARSEPDGAVPESVEESSLVEALDSLPRPGWTDSSGLGLSVVGRERVSRLAGTLRALRGQAALPLAELVVEVERALRLDIEVAARPQVSASGARAHLDAFAQVAAGFAATADVPTLAGFLAWLAAAELRERGLAPGQSDSGEVEVLDGDGRPTDVTVSTGAVQLLTVHAAKGLEWDVVAIPGLVEGILPIGMSAPKHDGTEWARPADSASGWRTITKGGIPYELRGDVDGLPALSVDTCSDTKELATELADFESRCGAYAVAEERRLAYVAITRAKQALLLTAHVWGTPGRTPRVTSRFVEELLTGQVSGLIEALPDWAPMPEPAVDLVNPSPPDQASADWPVDPLGPRRASVEAGAARVRSAIGADALRSAGTPQPPSRWAAEIDVLLAERDRARSRDVAVELPAHLSASRLVRLAEDPVALAGELRRPMPRAPAPAARRGTAFHAWIERRFGAAAMVDILELPGSADEAPASDDLLPELQANFLASEWADRVPVAIEVAIETPVAGTVIRGRIDAVFATADGGWDVVDWKTGAMPSGEAAAARSVQLAAYRLAWARLQGVPVERVGAAFFYAADGHTVRPVDLLDEAALTALVSGP